MKTDNVCPEIAIDVRDQILSIKIDRPEKKNALNRDMYAAMAEAIIQADDDAGIRVVLLHGDRDCFTAGNDLQDFKEFEPDGKTRPLNPFLVAISRAQKPLVAAVGGVAVGVGTTMLLHFDLVYAGESARFRMPFVNLGLCPEAASSLLLPKLVGHQKASELLLLGESFSAAQAMEFGLVNAVYPDDELIDSAYGRAYELAQQPPASVRTTKALLKRSVSDLIAAAMSTEMAHFTERLGSAECAEALNAFLNIGNRIFRLSNSRQSCLTSIV